jgi:hypothetical protein
MKRKYEEWVRARLRGSRLAGEATERYARELIKTSSLAN